MPLYKCLGSAVFMFYARSGIQMKGTHSLRNAALQDVCRVSPS